MSRITNTPAAIATTLILAAAVNGCGASGPTDANPCASLDAALPAAPAGTDTMGVVERDGSGTGAKQAAIWLGFEQTWSYNHRWNRFGDLVAHDVADSRPCVALSHGAASGAGPDVATSVSKFAVVSSESVDFRPVSETREIRIEANERYEHTYTRRVANEGETGELHLMLNGWDLVHIGKDSDKPIAFELVAGDVVRDGKELVLTWSVALEMACSSAECLAGDGVEYRLDTEWLLVSGDPSQVAVTEQSFDEAYGWSTRDGEELDRPARAARIEGTRNTANAVIAWKGISMELGEQDDPSAPKEQHMLDWRSMVEPVAYDGHGYDFDLSLMFKNWTKGMVNAHALAGFAYREAGAVTMRADLALIQTGADTTARTCAWQGEVDWTDTTADIETGVDRTAVVLGDAGKVTAALAAPVSCR